MGRNIEVHFGIISEVIVFLAALKWINHKYLEREEYIVVVFERIRFPLMSKEEILACYHPPILSGIVKIPEVKQSLLNATCYILSKSLGQENLFSELAADQRKFLFEGEPMILWDLCMYEPDKFEVNRRNHAATKIQAAVRGCLTRKHLRESMSLAHCAAVVIQSAFRGYLVRKELKMEEKKSEELADSLLTFPKTRKVNENESFPNKTSYYESLMKSYENASSPPLLYIMGGFNPDMKGEGGEIYVFGGFSTETMSQISDAIYFDKKEQMWLPLSDIPKTDAGFMIAVCKQT
ncbi:hypothetical protein AVEN_232704-1 [Araneus ventricosus]|uniref:BACK domain-containing protein n=1 Tax=Araneus ventricosus TaxID=182803 RepID=A0A4Y2LWN4_ARAVE|nr:hypothetical protein AVEN_232704-1 [Araneus ventricosus]